MQVSRWSTMSYDELISCPPDQRIYQVEHDSRQYQVEVEILEKTEDYVHVMVAVDDGTLPASIVPAARTFLVRKTAKNVDNPGQ